MTYELELPLNFVAYGAWAPYFFGFLLCFVGGVILALPRLISAIRSKNKVFLLHRLIFGCVCILLAFNKLWLYPLIYSWIPIVLDSGLNSDYVIYLCSFISAYSLCRCIEAVPQVPQTCSLPTRAKQ